MAILDVFTRVTRVVSGGVATNDQTITGGAVGFPSAATNVINISTTGLLREVGAGQEVVMRVRVTEAFVSAGGGGLNFRVALGNDETLLSNLIFLAGVDLPNAAAAPLGAEYYVPVAPMSEAALGVFTGRSHMGAVWIPVTATFEQGKVEIDFGTWRGNLKPTRHAVGHGATP